MRRGFVILDFETTGLAAFRGDRILEVGAVYMDPDQQISGGIETLVNPRRDVGPTRVHGITARDVYDAPTFDRVAPAILKILDGRVIVGHNVPFDLRFLRAELEREGYEVPDFVAIDTMQVAKKLLRGERLSSYRLHDLASHFGWGISDVLQHAGLDDRPEHSALGDAMVTAYLLGTLMEMSAGSSFWNHHLDLAEAVTWPEYVPVEVAAKRRGETIIQPAASGTPGAPGGSGASGAPGASVSAVLHALGAASPTAASTAQYSQLLEEALADRILESAEVDALVRTASTLGLDGVTLGSLHRGHFDSVVRLAWADGVVTEEERQDIVQLAELLGIDDDSLRDALNETAAPAASRNSVTGEGAESGGGGNGTATTNATGAATSTASGAPSVTHTVVQPGAQIVLTGDMSRERSAIEAEITALGFVVGSRVTKKTALVIAADPYTQSGKARKAHEYAIPVLGEIEGLALLRGGVAVS